MRTFPRTFGSRGSQKNIRRRVYDALNVLMALNIIFKEKKDIRWNGLPTTSTQEAALFEVRLLPMLTPQL